MRWSDRGHVEFNPPRVLEAPLRPFSAYEEGNSPVSRGHLGQDGAKPHGIVGNHPSFLWQLGRHQQPSPTTTLLSDKAHSVWGGFEEPGHPAARPNPDQRGTPPCSWLRMVCSPQFTPFLPSHACSRVCTCTGTLCGPRASLHLSLSQMHNRNDQLAKAGGWPCGCWAPELVPGGSEVLYSFPSHPGKRRWGRQVRFHFIATSTCQHKVSGATEPNRLIL